MNKRIRELMAEVGMSVDYLTNTKQIVLIEKFAELIVRECGNYMNSRIPGNLEVSATVAKMKQHFRVTE